MTADDDLTVAYRRCAREVRRSAANFYYAFQLLPARKRRALHAVYRFCRGADDIADGPGAASQRQRLLEAYRASLQAALAGHPSDPGWMIFADSVSNFDLDPKNLNEVIDGCALDCAPLTIRNEADLKRYSYGVAGAVGLLSARIFGYSSAEVETYAVSLGEAMQLTNILRDLAEDLGNGRCYLPLDELERFSLTPSDLGLGLDGPRADGYRALMALQVDRAAAHFREGLQLVALVDRDSRGCPAALAALYQRLLSEIRRRDFDVQSSRVSLSSTRKVGLAMGAWLRATLTT